MWTRIWWVRPLWSASSSNGRPSPYGAPAPCRRCGPACPLPSPPFWSASALERPIGASTSPRSSPTSPATRARYRRSIVLRRPAGPPGPGRPPACGRPPAGPTSPCRAGARCRAGRVRTRRRRPARPVRGTGPADHRPACPRRGRRPGARPVRPACPPPPPRRRRGPPRSARRPRPHAERSAASGSRMVSALLRSAGRGRPARWSVDQHPSGGDQSAAVARETFATMATPRSTRTPARSAGTDVLIAGPPRSSSAATSGPPRRSPGAPRCARRAP